MLSCQRSSALELSPQPSAFSCLSREQKDKIADCFSENQICRDMIKTKADAGVQYWDAIELSIAGGLLAGIIIGAELHK